ncbi:MAG: hypothetical protein KAS32_04745 [Candidatus Peribacteraceae bacterium]|nr:hypothetical protein [Candidatus Peribacteraceae bacterium]
MAEEIVNEVSRKRWVYDKDGTGRLCDTHDEAEQLIKDGEYFDHPNGYVKPEDKTITAIKVLLTDDAPKEPAVKTPVEPKVKKAKKGK